MCPYPCVDVSNVTVTEVRSDELVRVPCPLQITVEKQLRKSVLVSWLHPSSMLIPVLQYHVCVNGNVRAIVPACYNTKALVEDVDCSKPSRLSVRSVTDSGHSPDAACTITIGKDSSVAPEEVKAFSITPVSAQVSWYPGSSNFEHVILLNGLKVGNCPAGTYHVILKGLIPSTLYRCSVRVKDPRAVLEDKPVEGHYDFKTLSKIGLPDAPNNVQCEIGPQDGTLLVTWQPVMNQPKPPSRAAVSGYLVYADGRKVGEVNTPTGDHALLKWSDLCNDPPLFITVKTKTREGILSTDSNAVRVPNLDRPSTFMYSPRIQSIPAGVIYSHSATSAPMTVPSYYIFHPQLAQVDPGRVPTRPSLLEMETSYLLRQQQKSRASLKKRSASLDEEKSLEMQYRPQARIPQINVIGTHSGEEDVGFSSTRSEDRYAQPRHYQSTYSTRSSRLNRHLRSPSSRAVSEPDLRDDRRFVGGGALGNRPSETRCLVGLFDYNPRHMSPNRNAARDELPFRKGEMIKVLEEKDFDGFYLGELNGRIGLVPSNLVMEINNCPRYLPSVPTQEPMSLPLTKAPWKYAHRSPYSNVYSSSGGPKAPSYEQYRDVHPTSIDRDLWAPSSDPTLSRHFDYDTSSGTPEEKQTRANFRTRRMRLKQKSYSVEQSPVESSYAEHAGPLNVVEDEPPVVYHDYYQQRWPAQNEYDLSADYPEFRGMRQKVEPESRSNSQTYRSQHYATNPRRHRREHEYANQAYSEPSVGEGARIVNERRGAKANTLRHPIYQKHNERRHASKLGSLPVIYADSIHSEANSVENVSYARHGGRSSPYNAEQNYPAPADSDFDARKIVSSTEQMEQVIRHALSTGQIRTAVAEFDYDPKVLSPNVDAEQEELSFLAGDVITLYGDMDEDGFFVGELDGRYGLVPSNFIVINSEDVPPASVSNEEARDTTLPQRKEGVTFAPNSILREKDAPEESRDAETGKQGAGRIQQANSLPEEQSRQSLKANQVSAAGPTLRHAKSDPPRKMAESPAKKGSSGQQVSKKLAINSSNRKQPTGTQQGKSHADKGSHVKRDTGQGIGKMWKKIVE
ncbi:SH3 2 and SH3 9 domain containing protein [Trichuris trichiura]|uniref:SH3 2 and SH3 9 domain containing protein n=1 Tax=Trichuris trichiura TaxID=36087 RepID=A0A077Z6C3_TRITR|nr:SH3 2 and SH3 9 domain containing protein [Trichuris trichiura]